MRYTGKDDLETLKEIREAVLTQNLTLLSKGAMLFHDADIIVTDDIEEEYISTERPQTVVETPYAQELSWLLHWIGKDMRDTMSGYRREEFFGILADAANAFISRSDDRIGLLLAVLLQACELVAEQKQVRCQQIRDEVLSCAGSLSDLAEKI